MKLYRVLQKQKFVITKAEEGVYTEGIKSINIAKRDKPQWSNISGNLFRKTKTEMISSRPLTSRGNNLNTNKNFGSQSRLHHLPSLTPKANI